MVVTIIKKMNYFVNKVSPDILMHSHVDIHQSRGDIVLQPDTDNDHRLESSQGHMYSFHKL